MKKELFIIHRDQFGYHTDVYKWCEYLNDYYNIDILCFDEGRKKYIMQNVRIHYVPVRYGRYLSWLIFMIKSFLLLLFYKGIIIVSHFHKSRFIKKMLPWKKMILDIRTFSVHTDEKVRHDEDEQLFKSVKVFDYVTVISEGLRRLLPKPFEYSAVLPLGADIINNPPKSYNSIDLLYVGTFYNRHIENTIIGFAKARMQVPETIQMRYHIVGFGMSSEESFLKNIAEEQGVADCIFFHGRQPHEELKKFYEMCNVGVSYVPITSFYENQPVTKTYEYIMAGLYTIATSTHCNMEIISSSNGILIADDVDSFTNAIIEIIKKRDTLNSDKIRYSLNSFTWEHIVDYTMAGILVDFETKCLCI